MSGELRALIGRLGEVPVIVAAGDLTDEQRRIAGTLGVGVVTEEQAEILRHLAAAPKRAPLPEFRPAPLARRPSFTEREGIEHQWDIADRARAGHIAKAKAKRERKAARRLALASRRQRGEAE